MPDLLFSAMYPLIDEKWSAVLKINCKKTDFSIGIAFNSLPEKFIFFGDMEKYVLGKSLKNFDGWYYFDGMNLLIICNIEIALEVYFP